MGCVHSEERPFACDQCDAKFKTKGCLRSHKHSHSDLRPFECDICSAKFKTKSKLNTHKKTHDKPGYSSSVYVTIDEIVSIL